MIIIIIEKRNIDSKRSKINEVEPITYKVVGLYSKSLLIFPFDLSAKK